MDAMDALEVTSIIISIIAGVIIIILGIIAIFMSLEAVQTSRQNRHEAENVYEQTRDLLDKIDQRSSTEEQRVPKNFLYRPLDTHRDLIDEDVSVTVP